VGGGGPVFCTGQCGTTGCGSCPDAAVVTGPAFDIDRTEVTRTAYQAWLAVGPRPADLPSACAGHSSFTPAEAWPPDAGNRQDPVASVSWCAAWAYCHWARRHLCGAFDGGALASGDYRDPSSSEWMAACGPADFPYGVSYDASACNGAHSSTPAAAGVCSFSGCDGGLPGLCDMSGNVGEWEDACDTGAGLLDECHVRGGTFQDQAGFLRCDDPGSASRDTRLPTIGFRCCAP
jgi:formylglycine-generating enzyme required for sulfatase activity